MVFQFVHVGVLFLQQMGKSCGLPACPVSRPPWAQRTGWKGVGASPGRDLVPRPRGSSPAPPGGPPEPSAGADPGPLLCSDLTNGADGTLATSSSGSQYSGSRVETPVSYVGEDDEEDDDFNDDDEEA